MSNTVADGTVVTIHFTLTDAAGRVVGSTRGGEPMAYLHGHQNIVPALEAVLVGKAEGDEVREVVKAYGERKGKGAQAVPRREFPKDVDLVEGRPLQIQGSDGEPVQVWVTKVQGARVWIDIDHPMAGQDLTFEAQILSVRPAETVELEHGHAHGPEGHHH
jgi:FKBP-type peptidyl-prolyl cis-trans isomerase SlyD